MKKPVSVAIDGPSGAGKSTVAKAVAARFGFIYVDTGAIYRTVGLAAKRRGADPTDERAVAALLPDIAVEISYDAGVQHMLLNGEDVSTEIRTPEISRYASDVSALPVVREYLLNMQRSMAETRDVVMDGRDIGTVVLPDAGLKIFLTASPEERARRRWLELRERGDGSTLEQVMGDMERRDRNDSTRAAAPLRAAEDSVAVDTTGMTLDESIEHICKMIGERFGI